MKMYVRWMGAFRKNDRYSFMETLEYEWSRTDEAACEIIRKHSNGKIWSGVAKRNVRVGLLIDPSCVFREFKYDCWSRYEGGGSSGKLLFGNGEHSNHTEAWVKMSHAVIGIVVYGGVRQLSRYALDAIKAYQKKHDLPMYVLGNGQIDRIG